MFKFVIILSTILIYVSFLPFLHQISITPEDKIFMGTHNNALDYPIFISTIIQAERGSWTNLSKFTSEEQPGTLVHFYYIPFGKIGALFNLNPVVVYHLTRIITAFIFSLAVYLFIQYVFKITANENLGLTIVKRKLAFFLVLFSAPFVKIVTNPNGSKIFKPFLEWWSGADVFRRSVFIPHAMAKNILLLLIIIWMGKFLTGGKKLYYYLCLPAGIILGLLDPMNSIAILALLGIYALFLITSQKEKFISFLPKLFKIAIYFLMVGLSLIYINWVFNNTPWKTGKDWESQQYNQIGLFDYANHIGITFYLGVPGLILLVKRYKNIGSIVSLILAFASIFFLITGISRSFGLSTLRFFQVPVYVFLGVGASELIVSTISKFNRKLFSFLVLLTCIFILLISLPTYYFSLTSQFSEFKTQYPNLYVDKNIYQAALFLKENTPLNSAVLSDFTVGSVIPAISGNNVYVGHPVSTINFSQKEVLANKFLGGLMRAEEAKKTLIDGRVNCVFSYGNQRSNLEAKKYPFLKPIYSNSLVTIYEFRP